MTLVEVLVALVILGLMAGAVVEAIRLGAASWNRGQQSGDRTEDLDTVHALVRGVIAGAYPAFASTDPRDRRIVFRGEPDSLTLIAPLPNLTPDGAWARMRFWRREHAGSGALVLEWHLDLPTSDHRPPSAQIDRLLPSVASLRLDYFGATEPGQAPAWQDRWVDRDRLPALVRIRIRRDPMRGETDGLWWPDIVVATRVTATSACVYSAADTMCHRVP